jgi:bile acid:Na+ symporter, BASS family
MRQIRLGFLAAAAVALLVLAVGVLTHNAALWRPAAIAAAAGAAVGIGAFPKARTFQFTLWIIAVFAGGMIYPGAFQSWGGVSLKHPWLMLVVIQAVMFGMGTQMSLRDFSGVAKQPRGVFVGMVCHFTVMPLVGFGLTKIFKLPPEIAAGVVLIGSTSSGLASNVMAYIARANLPLSVTVTAITTMIAPFITPLWMKVLVRQDDVPVSYVGMMMEIIKFTLVPIGAALVHDYLKHATPRGKRVVLGLAGIAVAWLVFLGAGGWGWIASALMPAVAATKAREPFSLSLVTMSGFLFSVPLVGWLYHHLTRMISKLDSYTPVASMFGIVYYTLVTTAAGQQNLMKVGLLLFLASVIHNGAGYFFGYFFSRAVRLDVNSARSVAFEVGLQNGGMATGIANALGKLPTLGLAATIFSPWMNVSGSLLANYWRRKPVAAKATDSALARDLQSEQVAPK